MDIAATKGTKVIFNGTGGYDSELRNAKKLLRIGNTYTVDYTVIHGWSTEVFLKEVPNVSFNSVHFDDVESNEISHDEYKNALEIIKKYEHRSNELNVKVKINAIITTVFKFSSDWSDENLKKELNQNLLSYIDLNNINHIDYENVELEMINGRML